MKTLFLLAGLAAAAAPGFAASMVTDPTVSSGPTASVTVLLTGAPANDIIAGFGFNVVVLNAGVATFAGFTPSESFSAAALPAGTNVLATGFVETADPGYTEPFVLVTLLFNRVAFGSTGFTITGDTSDVNQGIVYAFTDTEGVALQGTLDFVPEPATFALAGAALAGLVALGRRRKQ